MLLTTKMPANYEMMVSHGLSVYGQSPPTSFLADYSNGDYTFFNEPIKSCRPQVLTPPQSRKKFQFTQNDNLTEKKVVVKPTPKPCLVIRSHDDVAENANLLEKSTGRTKKKVVFADDQGYSLTQIRYMSEPSNCPPYWSLKFLAQITQGLVSPHPSEQWVVDFKQPASDYLVFRNKIDTKNVSLENVIIKENESIVVGTIKVKNVSFEKEVIVRVTWDNWKSQQDIFCTYQEVYGPSSAYVIYDTFSFKITLPPSSKKLEFCICFRSEGREFWDNNDDKNYTLSKRSNTQPDYQSYKNYINTGNHTSLNNNNNNPSNEVSTIRKPIQEQNKSQGLTWSDYSQWNQNRMPYW